jgi:hypothetical protein
MNYRPLLQLRYFHSSLIPAHRLFKHLRTLSFSISQLIPATPITSALFHKKQGGTPPGWSYHGSSISAVGCQPPAVSSLLSSFPKSLTQKQGGYRVLVIPEKSGMGEPIPYKRGSQEHVPLISEVDPVGEDEGEGGGADDEPEDEALEEGANADFG